MKSVAEGFNRLAPFYTVLTRMVFGKTLQHAQEKFLPVLKAGDYVLMIGGGSGELLKSVLKQPGIRVDYIDISPRMLELARKRTSNPACVNFIVGTEEIIPDRKYSVVITNFYLDLFSDKTLPVVIEKIKRKLDKDGLWLVTDFVSGKRWHDVMLWIMYRFFRSTTHIEATHLPNWSSRFTEFTEVQSAQFYGRFIKAVVYQAA